MNRKLTARIILTVLFIAVLTPVFSAAIEGNSTLSGTTGYIVVPSARVVDSSRNAVVTTGYSAMFSTGGQFSHIPYFQIGFAEDFETALAVDISSTVDMILQAKWQFVEKNTTSFAFVINGQGLDIGNSISFAGQAGFAATYSSSIVDFPSKTTVYVGYTFDDTMNSDIDFAMAFETPLWKKGFKEKVNILLDFGNVSYSVNPSGGDATSRGLLNVGLRLIPIEFITNTYVMADVRLLDLFDHSGRAVNAGISISFRP